MSLLGTLFPEVVRVVDKLIPDKTKAEEIKAALHSQMETLLSDSDKEQSEINLEEAKSEDRFKSYWRPAVGWVGVFGLAWACIIQPFLSWVMVMLIHSTSTPPSVDTGTLVSMLTGILGIGYYRSLDKQNNTGR